MHLGNCSKPGLDAPQPSSLLEGLMETIDAGIIVIDADGRVIFANGYSSGCLGAEEPPDGRLLAEIPPDGARLMEVTYGPRGKGIFVPLSDGSVKWVCWSAFDLEGRIFRSILFVDAEGAQDGRKTGENARLLATVAGATRFLRHELRNPLSGILAGLQVLGAERMRHEEVQTIVQLLVDEVKSADGVLDRLVGAARIEVSEPKPHRLAQLISRFTEDSALKASGPRPIFEVIPGPPDAAATMDLNAMIRTLQNLAAFCLQAFDTGGYSRIGWRDVKEDEAASLFPGFRGRIVNLFVEVTGKPMPEEATEMSLSRLFVAWGSKWAGLGAAAACQIVDIHGGVVRFRRLSPGGVFMDMFLPADLPTSCGPGLQCRCADRAGEPDRGPSGEQKPSGESGPCWFSEGLARRVETGEWLEICLTCPVFRAHNLSLYES